jgi:hypothetical protein
VASKLLSRYGEVRAPLLRDVVASVLILAILAVVVLYSLSGFMHIVLSFTAALLSVVLVRRRPIA